MNIYTVHTLLSGCYLERFLFSFLPAVYEMWSSVTSTSLLYPTLYSAKRYNLQIFLPIWWVKICCYFKFHFFIHEVEYFLFLLATVYFFLLFIGWSYFAHFSVKMLVFFLTFTLSNPSAHFPGIFLYPIFSFVLRFLIFILGETSFHLSLNCNTYIKLNNNIWNYLTVFMLTASLFVLWFKKNSWLFSWSAKM